MQLRRSNLFFSKRAFFYGRVLILLCSLFSNQLFTQSDNYWSWNFNTPSTLMAGSVVAGGAGPSAVFYNPALIDRDSFASLSISASIFSFQLLKVKNLAGTGINANNLNFKVEPRFFSLALPKKNKKIGMELAFISPFSEDIDYTIQHFDRLDIIKRMEGDENYSGHIDYSRKYDDRWAGYGISYGLSDHFFLGGSAFFSFKKLNYKNRQLTSATQEIDSVLINQNLEPVYFAQSSFEEALNYWDLSLIFKIGAQYKSRNDRFRLGLNLTFPNIPVLGQADVRKTYSKSNVFDDLSGTFTANELIIEEENNVKTNIKTPFSVAVGLQFITKEHEDIFSFSVEYFSAISPYAIIETSNRTIDLPEYLAKKISENAFMPYYAEARSVVNAGIGLKQHINANLYAFGGFRTDFTAGLIDGTRFVDNKFKISQIQMNLYHFTVGPVLKIWRSTFVTGIQYSLGRNKQLTQVANFSSPVEYISETGQALEGVLGNNVEASINQLSFFLGITVDLFKRNQYNQSIF